MKWIDLPPTWLLLFLAVTWQVGQIEGLSASFPGAFALGTFLLGLGLCVMALAILTMVRARTTVIPHLEAQNLVTHGIFSVSRNPIYLGDAFILAGCALRWDAAAALILVPIFVWIIQTRFIRGEEQRLRDRFGEAFQAYTTRTRRWL